MINDIKKNVSPIVNLIKELNVQIKNDSIDMDFILKLATTMKVSATKLEKIVKENKNQLNGGVIKPPDGEDEE